MSVATPSATAGNVTGPKTDEGMRITARNATTHGLFARDVVLPQLGEDPSAYRAFLDELTNQLKPSNLLEQHYTEKIAAASWRLRRLHRWQAQLLEDDVLSDDEVLAKLDRVMRHETTLHRQIDTSVKMLGRDVPQLFEGRARKAAMALMQVTERDLRTDEEWDWVIANETRATLGKLSAQPAALDAARFDNAPVAAICQNETAPCHSSSPCSEGVLTPEGVLHAFCQNEPHSSPAPHYWGGGASEARGANLMRRH